MLQDIIPDRGVLAGEGAQALHKVGVGQKADVQNQVGSRGDAVFVSKGNQMEPEALLGGEVGILFLDQLPQLMGGVIGAVDDALRQAPQAGQGFPFRPQGLGDGFPVRQGVLAPGLAEPPDEGLFIGLQEDEVEFEPLALQAAEDPGIILQKPLGTHVHYQGDLAAVPGGAGLHVQEPRQQA